MTLLTSMAVEGGVGSRLLEVLLREVGSEKVLATAREDTPGFDFFMARGWEVIARISEFYHPGQERARWLLAALILRTEPVE